MKPNCQVSDKYSAYFGQSDTHDDNISLTSVFLWEQIWSMPLTSTSR